MNIVELNQKEISSISGGISLGQIKKSLNDFISNPKVQIAAATAVAVVGSIALFVIGRYAKRCCAGNTNTNAAPNAKVAPPLPTSSHGSGTLNKLIFRDGAIPDALLS